MKQSLESDLAAMLCKPKNLDEVQHMLFLKDFLNEFNVENRIRKWIVRIMRKNGWRTAFEVLANYIDGGCGIRG